MSNKSQEELTLEQILDAHAAVYAQSTMDYITGGITEDEREKEFHHSDLKNTSCYSKHYL